MRTAGAAFARSRGVFAAGLLGALAPLLAAAGADEATLPEELPVNQALTPTGVLIDLPHLRPQVIAASPDGARLVTAGLTHELVVIAAATGRLLERVPLPASPGPAAGTAPSSTHWLKPDDSAQASFTGLVFSPDGRRLFLSDVNGSIKVFRVDRDHVLPEASWPLPAVHAVRREEEVPTGLALSRDGRSLYVCGNLSNRLLELSTEDGRVLRAIAVGVAPYEVVLAGHRAFVSNWGGRRPQAGDLAGPAGRGTTVRVDPVRFIASEGSVSVLDLRDGRTEAELVTGRHASALALAPGGRYLACANAAADTVSVIDTRHLAVVETIPVQTDPGGSFGASPDALAFARDGRTLFVANGTQNAVAVVTFDPADRESRVRGLIPVGWFPAALAVLPADGRLAVANLKGPVSAGRDQPSHNSLAHGGSVTLVAPDDRALPGWTAAAERNLRRPVIAASRLPPRPGQPPRPVPERIGEPSVFRHVVYIIKENRTYDQVLGDLPAGQGDPRLCVFGEDITPNAHALARTFVLLDHTFCSGRLSADGHEWSTAAIATDYVEKQFADFPRSYPDGMGDDEADALAYSPAGFLWDNLLAHGRTVRDYGEFAAPDVRWRDPARAGEPGFTDCYRQWRDGGEAVSIGSHPVIPSLVPHAAPGAIGWGLEVPDQYRADVFIRDWRALEARGALPDLAIVCLPNDHTSGTSPGAPTPAAAVADNDLALGRIVEALSHGPAWSETVVFVIEDDPQNGWDHVSGYRTTAYCASAYTKRGAVVSTRYNTTSVLRTIEQILGVPPMNQFDASATTMADCFTATPDLTPFAARPARVPLDQLNPPAHALGDRQLRRDAEASGRLNLRQPDQVPETLLNQILWRAQRGPASPYPAWATHPDDDDHG